MFFWPPVREPSFLGAGSWTVGGGVLEVEAEAGSELRAKGQGPGRCSVQFTGG